MENKEALNVLMTIFNNTNQNDIQQAIILASKALTMQEEIRIAKERKEKKLAEAVGVLISALDEDQAPGSYYGGWQSNIACTIVDNSEVNHDQANLIAKKFLNKLINSGNGNV